MAHSYSLDTLSIAKELINAGFTQSQAEAQVRIFREQMENVRREREQELEAKQLATKGDIYKLEKEIERVRLEIKSSEIKLIYWIVGFIVGSMLALAGLMITLFQIYK